MPFWSRRPPEEPPSWEEMFPLEAMLRSQLDDVLIVQERRLIGRSVAFGGTLLVEPSAAVERLRPRLARHGYTPFLREDAGARVGARDRPGGGGRAVAAARPSRTVPRHGRHDAPRRHAAPGRGPVRRAVAEPEPDRRRSAVRRVAPRDPRRPRVRPLRARSPPRLARLAAVLHSGAAGPAVPPGDHGRGDPAARGDPRSTGPVRHGRGGAAGGPRGRGPDLRAGPQAVVRRPDSPGSGRGRRIRPVRRCTCSPSSSSG